MMSSPFAKSDVLSNRFSNGHDLPSVLNEEAVVQLAESRRDKSLHAEVRQEPAWLANNEEISSTPYYPLQPLSVWHHPTKGIGRYRSGYVKPPPGSYNTWMTGKGNGKVDEETNENLQRATVSRVNIIQLASNLTSAAASSVAQQGSTSRTRRKHGERTAVRLRLPPRHLLQYSDAIRRRRKHGSSSTTTRSNSLHGRSHISRRLSRVEKEPGNAQGGD